MAVPSRQEILEKFAAIVGRSLHVDPARVTEETYLDDLGAESLDLIEISMGIEEAFDLWLSDKSILQTARDIYGPGVLEKDGVLTGTAKALLLARMPELDPALLEGDVQLSGMNRQFMRVSGWIGMIEGLIAASPQVCPKCGGEFGRAVAFKRKCTQCGEETALVSGEEVNRRWVREYRATLAPPSESALAPGPVLQSPASEDRSAS
jgi:acyl carrier protein